MPVDLVVPSLGESVASVVIVEWKKSIGQAVSAREDVVEVESDKATQNIPSAVNGVLVEILKKAGDAALIGEVIARIDEKAVATIAAGSPNSSPASTEAAVSESRVMPAAARVMSEHNLTPAQVSATGPGGRILKEDAEKAAARPSAAPAIPSAAPTVVTPSAPAAKAITRVVGDRVTRRQAMSPIRKRIAQRLMDAQHSAALLTTFNEIDMTDVMALRKQHQDAFVERHGVKLGFMSFFVKAAVDALQAIPQLNAEIQGGEMVFHDYCDIGIAIGGGKGLVVPILRNAESMTFSTIEKTIGDFGARAKNGTLSPSELQGGTFTISNGGVYGSLLSTPIVNPPQSGVLGMHSIQERPVVRDGQIVIRSMMYIALTYDHRIVDGKEAVTFLKRIKDCLENPLRLMLEV